MTSLLLCYDFVPRMRSLFSLPLFISEIRLHYQDDASLVTEVTPLPLSRSHAATIIPSQFMHFYSVRGAGDTIPWVLASYDPRSDEFW
jgi:hypothetical protein